ncbi:MAG: hypothetical protein CL885_03285, partial [Dehalococcoidia bacterium]|nr:hypothetical protein [Dehalococcoidia bacterium]
YWVEIANSIGKIRSAIVALDIVVAPVITVNPINARAEIGNSAQFNVVATGSSPLSFKWYKNGIRIEGENKENLHFESIAESDRGNYSVVVSNRGGSIESAFAELAILLPVNILDDVSDLTVREGALARFTVEVSGTEPLSYQWFYGGNPIQGANDALYEIGAVNEGNRGLYSVEVENELGRIRSRDAKLNVSITPELTRQLSDQIVLKGGALTLQASASGTEPMVYNWYRQGKLYRRGGANLTIQNINAEDAGLYQVEVVNEVGSVRGEVFEISVIEPVKIVSQPRDSRVNEGAVTVMEVGAEGSGPISYQWYHDGQILDGANSSQYRILSTDESHRGIYEVDVSNSTGTVRSAIAKLKVILAPTIISQLEPFTGKVGDQFVLQVAGAGSGPLMYDWYRDDLLLSSGQNTEYRVNAASTRDNGNYSVVVRNTAGEEQSIGVPVIIYQPVEIIEQPLASRVISGGNTKVIVSASGSGPITYKWLFNNREMLNSNTTILKLDGVNNVHEGSYQVVISNPAGSIVSNEVRLSVLQPVVILEEPTGGTKLFGEPYTLKVEASGSEPLNYQWYKNGEILKDAQDSKIEFRALIPDNQGVYSVKISNEAGSTLSKEVKLVVHEPIRVTQQPQNIRVIEGDSAYFEVKSTGTQPINYEWRFNGSVIEGEENSTLRVNGASKSDQGTYQVIMKNIAGGAVSEEVQLTVVQPVVILDEPKSTTQLLGQALKLSAVASGSEPLKYEWYKDGQLIAESNDRLLDIETLGYENAGTYKVRISNEAGYVTSTDAVVTVHEPITIIGQPMEARVIEGGEVIFQVEAKGTAPINYEWRFNGDAIDGADDPEYKIINANIENIGSYQVIMTNPVGVAISKEVKLSVVRPVDIIEEPEGVAKLLGQALELSVVASGSEPLNYQWFKDGQVLTEFIGDSIFIKSLNVNDGGIYKVQVSNEAGAQYSADARVEVHQPITILKQPTEARVIKGGNAVFNIEADGTKPIDYSWRFNGEVLQGEIGPKLFIPNADLENEGVYQVVMSNPAGGMVSQEANLNVVRPVVILEQPQGAVKLVGESLSMSVVASGTEPLQYQWYKDGELLVGTENLDFTIDSVSSEDAGIYKVYISNEAGLVESLTADVIVNQPVVITKQPENARVIDGADATFNVEVIGTPPILFKWLYNGVVLEGENEPNLSISKVGSDSEGVYQSVMTNAAGGAVSKEVKLTVVQPIKISKQPDAILDRVQKESIMLEVVASGSQPIDYQWFKDDQAIEGAGSPRFEVTKVSSLHSGVYYLKLSNEAGEVISESSVVNVYDPIRFIDLPEQVQVFAGDDAEISVSAVGSTPIEFQWLYENEPIQGRVNRTLLIENVNDNDVGKYRLVASNPAGKVISPEVRLLMLNRAVITVPPKGDVLRKGETLSLMVAASGTEPLAYKWMHNGQVLEGFNNARLEILDVQPSDSGVYSVEVSNLGGVDLSEDVIVEVNEPIRFIKEPVDKIIPLNYSATFEVQSTGSNPKSYQWLKNGIPIVGAIANTITIDDVELSDSGEYQVLVTNPAGELLSRGASLRVARPVEIKTQPTGAQVREGQPFDIIVKASGTEPINYQWYKDGLVIDGENDPGLRFESTSELDSGAYHVVIGNEVGQIESQIADLEILLPPSVGDLDELMEVYKGATVSITAPVSGYGTFNYQWLKNGVNIPGAIDKTLVLVNVSVKDSGSYSLNVGSEGGALYSNAMNFRVLTDQIRLADNFEDVEQVRGMRGEFRGSSVGATSEELESGHAGAKASASVWLRWQATASGITTFNSRGSNFDTTLAIYTGDALGELIEKSSDSDSGGFLTSKLRFNAIKGEVYSIAVDGFNGATGDIVLSWQLEETEAVLPVIVSHPTSTTGIIGQKAGFEVRLEVETDEIRYVWFKDGNLLPNETSSQLVFERVSLSDVGVYTVHVYSGSESVSSDEALLLVQYDENEQETDVSTKLDLGSLFGGGADKGDIGDKEGDLVFGGPKLLPRLIAKLRSIEKKPGEFSFSGSTVYSTTGAAKDPGEPNHAGNTGGASAWTTFTPTEEGTAKLSTENSDFDTVLAIYKVGAGDGWDALEEVASDDNGGEDGEDSEVVFEVKEGVTYLVAVDGVGGETGTVQLNHELSKTPVIDSITESANGLLGGTVQLVAQASSQLADSELKYQWRRDGNILEEGVESELILNDLEYTDAGNYTLEVSSFAGSTISEEIPVRVIQPITILDEPANTTGVVGGSVVLSVSVTGADPISYEWRHGGQPIAGNNEATLTLTDLSQSSAGAYQVVVTNPAGSVLSDSANLTIDTPPVIEALTDDQNIIAGETVALKVEASGTTPLSYAWKLDGALIEGQTSNELTLRDISGTHAGVYSVEVSNPVGIIVSDGVNVSVVQ